MTACAGRGGPTPCPDEPVAEYRWRHHGRQPDAWRPLCEHHAEQVAMWLTVFSDPLDEGITVSQRRLRGGAS